ncbi:paraquat-inducible protein B [Vibrio variabilis]|uniref:Paraquat-inducible protein B n=1 Tax=Vibrio variabilis TaxID=990271 RepID=A0ABQ0JPK3_9VIBR|nr:paraquat-inducible protein B [Vibrio variabilis]
MVRDINLSDDLSNIYVDADIYPEAAKLLGEDTKFWLVKPLPLCLGFLVLMRWSRVTISLFIQHLNPAVRALSSMR